MSAMAAYEKSRIELDRATGVTLDHAGISIDDAARGQVTRMPNVPYVAPRKDLPSVRTAAQPPAAAAVARRHAIRQARSYEPRRFCSSSQFFTIPACSAKLLPLR